MALLDFLFPKYCVSCKKLGSYLCADCFAWLSFDTKPRCLVCELPSIDGLTHPRCRSRYAIDGAFSSILYKGVAKKLLYVFKYKPYVSRLKEILAELFYEGLIQKEEFSTALVHNPLLVPIPLHSSKLRQRGYNQSEILGNELSMRFKLPLKNLLQRVKKTQSQFGLKKEERKENIAGAFSIVSRVQAGQYPSIFLVDDILTTGATLSEAARVLKKAGAKKVWGLTFAQD